MTDSDQKEDSAGGERSAALLTTSQREFLRHGYESGNPSARAVRSRIRRRIQDSIMDMTLIAARLEDRDIELIFENLFSEDRTEFNDGIVHTLAFLYAGIGDSDLFGEYLSRGVDIGEKYLNDAPGLIVNVDFAVETESLRDRSMWDTAVRIARGDIHDLSEGEMRRFLQSMRMGQFAGPQNGEVSEEEQEIYDNFIDNIKETIRAASISDEEVFPVEHLKKMREEEDYPNSDGENEDAEDVSNSDKSDCGSDTK